MAELIPAEQIFFTQVIEDYQKLKVEVVGTKEGFEITFKLPNGKHYILYTQRGAPRRIKSPSTLFNVLKDFGVIDIVVKGIDICGVDAYVKKNQIRHQKRLIKGSRAPAVRSPKGSSKA